MGRGRTTTAMVIASLVRLRLRGSLDGLPPLPVALPATLEDDDLALRRGDYAVIRALLRVVDGGKEAKHTVDEARLAPLAADASLANSECRLALQVIDRCAHMQNLREAILTYRRALGQELDEKQRAAALQRGVEYLERYWTLCAFAAYIHDPAWTAASSTLGGGFQTWMSRRPELQSVLRRLLWRNPMGALANAPSPLPSSPAAGDADGDTAVDAATTRCGAVLGAHCILKVRACAFSI